MFSYASRALESQSQPHPASLGLEGVGAHVPFKQKGVARLHAAPQAPQLSESVLRSVQLPASEAVQIVAGDAQSQVPATQAAPVGQLAPQAPQLFGSVCSATQRPLQRLLASGQAHAPASHASTAASTSPEVALASWIAASLGPGLLSNCKTAPQPMAARLENQQPRRTDDFMCDCWSLSSSEENRSVSKSSQHLVDHGEERAARILAAEAGRTLAGVIPASQGDQRLDAERLALLRELARLVRACVLVERRERLFAVATRES